MEVRTLVTFRSNQFNMTESKPNYINAGCFGDDVADWFLQRLASSGMAVDTKIGQEDFGWYLGFRSGPYRYHFVLGYNPDGYWMGELERQRGLIASLFGARKRGIQPDAANAIHSVLASAEGVSEVRWHFQKDFDALGPDLGTLTPLADA
jgi:hypothetical protein